MTNPFKAAGLVVLVPLFVAVYAGGAAADLQGCFRDGYLCSIKCDASGLAKVDAAQCQTQCIAEEKLCLREVSARIRPMTPRYSSAANPVAFKRINSLQASASGR